MNGQDFDGCSRECREGHTYEWGRCELGVRRPPALFHHRTVVAGDGELVVEMASLPLTLFLPWSAHLPASDQNLMLAELDEATPQDREALLSAWRTTAEALADPTRRDVLLGNFDPADFVETKRPFATGGTVTSADSPVFGESGCTYRLPRARLSWAHLGPVEFVLDESMRDLDFDRLHMAVGRDATPAPDQPEATADGPNTERTNN